MNEDTLLSNPDFTRLSMYYCGSSQCKPDHSYGPAMRDHYLFVYIKSGCGEYKINNLIYQLHDRDSFMLFPNIPAYYKADHDNPWEYMWVGFFGTQAQNYLQYAGITPEDPILRHSDPGQIEDIFSRILAYPHRKGIYEELHCTGLLYAMFAEIIKNSGSNRSDFIPKELSIKDMYVQKAVRFIHMNYSRAITVTAIAEHIGLERSYFSKVFKQNIGMSPYEFLLKYRTEKAARLLEHTSMPIEHIAYSVGFENPLYFSKAFRKRSGLSPTEFRNSKAK